MRLIYAMIIGVFILSSCDMSTNSPSQVSENDYQHQVEVKEVLQTSSYTYFLVTEYGEELWMATNKMEVKEGESLYFDDAMVMVNFPSRELDRTFEKILFVEKISNNPQKEDLNMQVPANHNAGKVIEPKADIEIEVIPGGLTIAEIYKNASDYAGKKVQVTGKVIKVNKNIMNLNWVHLQDGTQDDEHYDLTLTTTEVVEVGDTATFEGVVVLNKDFGHGYFYDLILENGTLK